MLYLITCYLALKHFSESHEVNMADHFLQNICSLNLVRLSLPCHRTSAGKITFFLLPLRLQKTGMLFSELRNTSHALVSPSLHFPNEAISPTYGRKHPQNFLHYSGKNHSACQRASFPWPVGHLLEIDVLSTDTFNAHVRKRFLSLLR